MATSDEPTEGPIRGRRMQRTRTVGRRTPRACAWLSLRLLAGTCRHGRSSPPPSASRRPRGNRDGHRDAGALGSVRRPGRHAPAQSGRERGHGHRRQPGSSSERGGVVADGGSRLRRCRSTLHHTACGRALVAGDRHAGARSRLRDLPGRCRCAEAGTHRVIPRQDAVALDKRRTLQDLCPGVGHVLVSRLKSSSARPKR